MHSRLLSSFIALALAGCVAAPAAQGPQGTVTATGYLAPRGSDGRLLALVTPWTAADVDHVQLTVSTGGSAVGTVPLTRATLYNRVAFNNLMANHTYTILAQAYNTSDGSVPIDNSGVSAPSCTTTFVTTNDTVVSIGAIALQLADRAFAGSGSAGVIIAAGSLVDPVGNEGFALQFRSLATAAGTGTAGFSGDAGLATAANLKFPYGVATDTSGNLYIADQQNNRVRLVCATPGTYYGQAMTKGKIYTVAGNGTAAFSGDGGAATSAAISGPCGVAVDSIGNLYIADTGNHRLRAVATDGSIATVAGTGTGGFSADAVAATSATLNAPIGVATDANGNVYVGDQFNHRVRFVCRAPGTYFGLARALGKIYTLAGTGTGGFAGDNGSATSAQLYYPCGVALDATGNVYVADSNNSRIRKVATNGVITTVAGTGVQGFGGDGAAATAAKLDTPTSIALDGDGNLYIADQNNNRIRRVIPTGTIATVAGTGTSGYSGDGGDGTLAQLSFPTGVGVDASGNVYVADQSNSRIRKL